MPSSDSPLSLTVGKNAGIYKVKSRLHMCHNTVALCLSKNIMDLILKLPIVDYT
jgi:hypothetical protein